MCCLNDFLCNHKTPYTMTYQLLEIKWYTFSKIKDYSYNINTCTRAISVSRFLCFKFGWYFMLKRLRGHLQVYCMIDVCKRQETLLQNRSKIIFFLISRWWVLSIFSFFLQILICDMLLKIRHLFRFSQSRGFGTYTLKCLNLLTIQ